MTLLIGDALTQLRTLPDESVHCCVTSPPYFGLRSYLPADSPDKAHEMGAEATPEEYVERLVAVFREVRRVLRSDGVCWVNLGDSYAGAGYSNHAGTNGAQRGDGGKQRHSYGTGLKSKDLCLIPYRVALALQADGWYLRSHVIWAKGVSFCEHYSGSVMPESVRDRPTSAHEAVFLLTKSQRYFYDADAVREACVDPVRDWSKTGGNLMGRGVQKVAGAHRDIGDRTGRAGGSGRNLRNVWAISPRPYSGSHYAVFPPHLVAPMVKAGCPKGGTVLDPFLGSGTTAQVAQDHGRKWIGIDLDPRNEALVAKRTAQQSLLG